MGFSLGSWIIAETGHSTKATFYSHGWTSLEVSLSEAYPIQYCCNLRARSPWVRVQIPQASWGMTVSWKSNPWAGQGMSASWDPWTGGSLSRLRCDNLSRIRSQAGQGRLTSWDSRTGIGHPQGLQHDQCQVGLRGCNFNSLPVCSLQMGIDIMMNSNPSLCPDTGNLVKQP